MSSFSFNVPPPSSPPTTTGKSSSRANGRFSFTTGEHPSTTPAGPPPPSVFSTTPAGPPPSGTFTSSNFGTGKSLFASKAFSNGGKAVPSRLFKTSPKLTFGANRSSAKASNGQKSKPSFLGAHRVETTESASASEVDVDDDGDEDEDEDAEGDIDPDAEGEEEEDEEEGREVYNEDDTEYDEDEDQDYTQEDADVDGEGETEEEDYESELSQDESEEDEDDEGTDHGERENTPRPFAPGNAPDLTTSTASGGDFDWAGLANESDAPPAAAAAATAAGLSSQGLKRSRGASTSLVETIEADLPPAKRRESALPRIAQDFAKAAGTAKLSDPDDLVVSTEEIVSGLARRAKAPSMAMGYEQRLAQALEKAPRDLIKVWKANTTKLVPDEENVGAGIGPSEDSDGATKAAFLASMLLRLYHPQSVSSSATPQPSHRRSLSRSTQLMRIGDEEQFVPYPRLLLDFLDSEHFSLEPAIKALYTQHPSPPVNSRFWDTLAAGIARGHFEYVHKILEFSDFQYAWRPREEGAGQLGYSGSQLDLIHHTVGRFTEVLGSCPALQDDDWEVSGSAWVLFRKQCEEALHELSTASSDQPKTLFSRPTPSAGLPDRVRSSLKVMYGVLLGRPAEIMSVSMDWLEATVGLTVWWNGEDDAGPVSLKASRRSNLGRSQVGRVVDVNPGAAYRRRLAQAVDMVTNGPDDDALMVDTTNAVEVGLASVFEENIEGVVGILQTWSLPITSAVLEISRWAGWYETPPSDARPEGFDDSDLMVLSYAKPSRALTKDDLLLSYSDLLFEKADFKAGQRVREGWELAIDVSYRLDDPTAAQKRMAWLITRVPAETDARANKIASVCQSFGMSEEARKACEAFADHVSTTSHNYGTALIYYARAHAAKKCKDVLDLLISMCLVRSAAYPPSTPDAASRGLDQHLASLIASPQESIRVIAGIDLEAANILSEHISGYATLRRFYDLRDQDLLPLTQSKRSVLRPRARLRAAAKAVLACIASAADSIQGGLYDASLSSVVQVDVLLALLAEAGEFLLGRRQERVFTMPQLMALLRATEDLQTVHARIRAQTEECLRACLETRWDGGVAATRLDPTELLKKSVSGLTDSSGFSLIGSEFTDAGSADRMGGVTNTTTTAAAKKDDVPRAWDWRDGWSRDSTGDDVLRRLRQGIAREIADLWIEEL